MSKVRCLCCDHKTLDERGSYEICPVCFWEDDAYFNFDDFKFKDKISSLHQTALSEDELLNIRSAANNGLTLREAKRNYKNFKAYDELMVKYVREALEDEL